MSSNWFCTLLILCAFPFAQMITQSASHRSSTGKFMMSWLQHHNYNRIYVSPCKKTNKQKTVYDSGVIYKYDSLFSAQAHIIQIIGDSS